MGQAKVRPPGDIGFFVYSVLYVPDRILSKNSFQEICPCSPFLIGFINLHRE
jgi:hypothetical protein